MRGLKGKLQTCKYGDGGAILAVTELLRSSVDAVTRAIICPGKDALNCALIYERVTGFEPV